MSKAEFEHVKAEIIEHAKTQALADLSHEAAPAKVAEFYNPTSSFAGATFTQLTPNDPDRLTATDLLAVTTLSVKILPHAIRTLVEDSTVSDDLTRLLNALPQRSAEAPGGLAEATPEDFRAMGDLYDLVKASLSHASVRNPNSWVTASKIAARKRPDLFPVRDSVVCKHLAIDGLRDYAKDWVVFREILRNPAITEALSGLRTRIGRLSEEHAAAQTIIRGEEDLRILDTMLWRMAPGSGKENRTAEA